MRKQTKLSEETAEGSQCWDKVVESCRKACQCPGATGTKSYTGEFKTAEMCCLTVLEARISNQGINKAVVHLKHVGRILPRLFLASDALLANLDIPWLAAA